MDKEQIRKRLVEAEENLKNWSKMNPNKQNKSNINILQKDIEKLKKWFVSCLDKEVSN
jgi:hypothetical protein